MSAALLLVACQWIPHAETVVPGGADTLPVDVRPVVFTEYFDTFSVELFDGTGLDAVEVPSIVAVVGDWYFVNPDEPLLPDHTYRLVMAGTAATWEDMYRSVAFTTGTGSGAGPPSRPVISWITAERAALEDSHTCGFNDVERVAIDLATSPAPYYEVELRTGPTTRTYLMQDLTFSNYRSGFLLSLQGEDTLCAKVTAIGFNGVRSAASAEWCQEVAHCSRSSLDVDWSDPCGGSSCSAGGAGAAPWPLLLVLAAARRKRRR